MPDYGRLTSQKDIKKGTEIGGVDNVIQPPPHDPANVPHETLMRLYQLNTEAGAIQYKDGSVEGETQPVPETKRIV